MSDHAEVVVGAGQFPAVREALLRVYAERAEARAETAGRTDPDRLADARAALLDADAALEALGAVALEPGELSGTVRLVGDVLVAAVSEAAVRLGGELEAYGHGVAALPDVEAAHARLGALLALFAAHQPEHPV